MKVARARRLRLKVRRYDQRNMRLVGVGNCPWLKCRDASRHRYQAADWKSYNRPMRRRSR